MIVTLRGDDFLILDDSFKDSLFQTLTNPVSIPI